MFGLQSLDVMIGLITIYLSVALACTAIVEMIAAWTNLRSKNLEAALQEILADDISHPSPDVDQSKTDGRPASFLDKFYAHPLVQSLSKGEKGRPAYISPETFSTVINDILTDGGQKQISEAISGLPESRIKSLLQTLASQAKGSDDQFLKNLEVHFDRVMDRASGWVKSRQQVVAFLVSALLVGAGNVDTFSIASALSSSPEVRGKVLDSAVNLLKENESSSAKSNETGESTTTNLSPAENSAMPVDVNEKAKKATDDAVKLMQSSGLPLGWETEKLDTIASWISKIVGLVISVFAISLGAPFWFEILQKIINVRQAGISPREKK